MGIGRACGVTALVLVTAFGCAEGTRQEAGTGGAAGFGGEGGSAGLGGIGGEAGSAGIAGLGGTGGDAGVSGLGGTGAVGGTGGDGGTAGIGGTGGTAGIGGTGGTAGVGGSAGFPRGNPVSVALRGQYTFMTYPMTDPDWASATMYYPTNAPAPFPVMAVSPGFTETKEQMTWWGEMLASHGFAVLLTTPFNTFTDQPPDRGKDLETAIARIKAENTRPDSPLFGKVAVDRLAISGHSMGGGGSLHAASTLRDQVRAVIPLMEHGPAVTAQTLSAITANVILIAGEADGEPLGPPTKYSIPHFQGLTNAENRCVAVVKGGDHFMAVNGGAHQDLIARYSVAWLKLYLEDDTRYETYIYGAEHQTMAAQWSTYMAP